jgi:hypothetical protein
MPVVLPSPLTNLITNPTAYLNILTFVRQMAPVAEVLLARLYNLTKKNEVGGACSMYGGGERCIQDFGRET